MNKKRQAIWNKSNGKYWYCGNQLSEKGWHADHFNPVIREIKHERIQGTLGYVAKQTGNVERPENLHIDNLVPACAPCNLFKATFGIEFFRREISAQIERARKTSVNFRTAERFGMIEIKEMPIVFWFEKQIGVSQ